jgi:5-methylcytosine-specific restriction protein B
MDADQHTPPQTVWIEKTLVQDRPDRQEGADRLGASLWSPQRSADGRDVYANMRAVKAGDLVLHLTDNDAITAVSTVAASFDDSFRGVPGTSWSDRPCYRVPLKDFRALQPPLRREWFFGDLDIAEQLRTLSTQPRGRGLFFSNKLELNQGAYLTEAPPSLATALDLAYLRHANKHVDGLPSALFANEEEEEDEAQSAFNQQPVQARRAWMYAPGQRAIYWDALYEEGAMALGWDDLGDFKNYKTLQEFRAALDRALNNGKDQGQNARMCFDFTYSMQIGDIVYVKCGLRMIVGRGIIEGDYAYDAERRTYTHFRKVRWTNRGEWPWPEQLPLKTLTEWTNYPDALRKIEALFTRGEVRSDPSPLPSTPSVQREAFTIDDACDGLFMHREDVARLLRTWEAKKNLIIQGAPGVGKSFVARRLAYALMRYKDPTRLRTVQFHQSYGYEDFVQGYRPTEEKFALRDGVFLTFCKRALNDPGERYIFIIDEINRGNLSKILGELMLLIEADKRHSDWGVKLAYAENAEERFYVPENVFILGMMNTADRSLAVVDYALRRRFSFATVMPAFGSSTFPAHLSAMGVEGATAAKLIDGMLALNEAIANDPTNLGRGYCIGHSFFTPTEKGVYGAAWYQQIIETEIVPLLEEYWFDKPELVVEWKGRLVA